MINLWKYRIWNTLNIILSFHDLIFTSYVCVNGDEHKQNTVLLHTVSCLSGFMLVMNVLKTYNFLVIRISNSNVMMLLLLSWPDYSLPTMLWCFLTTMIYLAKLDNLKDSVVLVYYWLSYGLNPNLPILIQCIKTLTAPAYSSSFGIQIHLKCQ